MMNPIDIAIIGILLFSAVISFLRGFVREVLSLIAWIVAVAIAVHYSPKFAALLLPYIDIVKIRVAVSFGILLVLTLVAAMIVNFALRQVVRITGFGGADRIIGILFGLIRGMVVVCVLVLAAHLLTPLPAHTWWQSSVMVEHFSQLTFWLRDQLPPEVTKFMQMK